MSAILRKTRSVCPMCLKNLPARLCRADNGVIILEKTCPVHGSFSVPVWAGRMDFEAWTLGAEPLPEGAGLSCPGNCGICAEHDSATCCTLLEVTNRCDLCCRYCFANGGDMADDPSTEELKDAIRDIVRQCGTPLLQFSGGEPTLRDDLPILVRFAKEAGCSHTQVNTNGIRLAQDPEYAKALAKAGLDIVFLQFDGTKDEIHEALRGRPLLKTKLEAIRVCADLHIGVTLVPTVVPGVNDGDLGNIVRLAASLAPGVRGVHFQPVSYFGRYPKAPSAANRYTLDMLMTDLSDQSEIPVESFLPSRCDHPLCGFHARYLIEPDGGLTPLTTITHAARTRGTAKDNREYIAKNWSRGTEETNHIERCPGSGSFSQSACSEIRSGAGSFGQSSGAEALSGAKASESCSGSVVPSEFYALRQKGEGCTEGLSASMDFDTFLSRVRRGSLTLSAMAFQDAMNLNIERLHRCSLHVYDRGKIKPFCAKYLSAYKTPPV